MDAAVAIFFLLTSVTDMVFTDCRSSCLERSKPDAELSVALARLEHRSDWSRRETYVRFDAPIQNGPLQHIFSIGVSSSNDVWVGAGARYTTQESFPSPFFMETSFQAGLHYRGEGPDIGGILHFRSGVGVGYDFDNGSSLSVTYDHRSNADRTIPNPGLNTFALRYAITLD